MLTTQALLQRQLPVNAGPNTNEILTKIHFAVKPL